MSDKNKISIITYPHLIGACAAALILKNKPTAKIIPASKNTFHYSLSQCIENKSKEIHICGVGFTCHEDEVLKLLKKLHENGAKVCWYCGGDYLDEFRPLFEKYCECFFDSDVLDNAYAVHKYFSDNSDDEQTKIILSVVGDVERLKIKGLSSSAAKEGKSDIAYINQLKNFVEASIWRSISYGDREIFPNVIKSLAGIREISVSDKQIIESHNREHGHILLGKSRPIKDIRNKIKQYSKSDEPVLILGETGTGKEIIARLIHEDSERSCGVFLAVNCATFTGELLQDTLFGHSKGAFTGAAETRAGIFEAAKGGTVFLDEIAEISPQVQAMLLRVLQEGTFFRLGETKEQQTDVRIIAATNKDLFKETESGRFREDLYYRLNVLKIDIPPLRERKEDIELLVNDFIYRYSLANKLEHIPIMSGANISILKNHYWRGNIRELQNFLHRWFALGYPNDIRQLLDSDKIPIIEDDEIIPLEEMEQKYIKQVFERFNHNISKTAEALKITRNTLKRKINEYKLN